MTSTTNAPELTRIDAAWLAAFSEERREPAWLRQLRSDAFARFAELPWPDHRDARWKRSEPWTVPWDTLRWDAAEAPLPTDTALEGASASPTPAQNGRPVGAHAIGGAPSTTATGEEGAVLIPLHTAIRDREAELRPAWEAAVAAAADNKFFLLTLALGSGGRCLFVPPNAGRLPPVRIPGAAGPAGTARASLTFAFIGDGADVSCWEEIGPLTAPHTAAHGHPTSLLMHAGATRLGAGATLQWTTVQNLPETAAQFRFQRVTQGPASRFHTVNVEMGGRVSHNATEIHLAGEGAENAALGILFGDGQQNHVTDITQRHLAPRTTSDIRFHGALQGSARTFFAGLVSIVKDAQKSDAYQSFKALLLSPGARADAIPNLEILADDVKCSHGAAVGPVEEDQKFYFQTRGVPPEEAENIIVQGFFEPVVAAIPSAETQTRLRDIIEDKLRRRAAAPAEETHPKEGDQSNHGTP